MPEVSKSRSALDLSAKQVTAAAVGSSPTGAGIARAPEEHWVTALYRVLLGREPDSPGLAAHVRSVQAGQRPEDLIRRFLQSREFAARYSKFAIAYGQKSHQSSPITDAEHGSPIDKSDPRYSIETLVEALYRGILSRSPDENGFANHVRRLTSLGTAAPDLIPFIRGFLASREYQVRTNRQFVRRLASIANFPSNAPIHFVSLGSHCLVSFTLKEMGLKRYSCPFDWIFSRPPMVEHCIRDSFATLADRSQYQPVVDPAGAEVTGRCHHAFYRASFGVESVFNHRDMRIEENYQYLLRCIQRFMKLLQSADRKIFVLLCPESLATGEQFVSLNETLSKSTSNFSLFLVMLKRSENSLQGFGLEYGRRFGPSCLAVMRAISKAGPYTFEDPLDDFTFRRAIVTFAASQEKSTVGREQNMI